MHLRSACSAFLASALVLLGCTSGGDDTGGATQRESPEAGGDGQEVGPSVRIATLNVLHGNPIAVPECAENDQCGAPDRVDLLMSQIAEADCPEIVTLQEVDLRIEELISRALPSVCDGRYVASLLADRSVSLGIDREMILTSLTIRTETLLDLPSVPWSAHHALIDSPIGPIDLVTTHLASGANNPSCGETECAPVCEADDDARTCGARQILQHLEAVSSGGVRVVTGDLNAEPAEPAHQLFVDAGHVDAYSESGSPECGAADTSGCTSGRSELDLTDPSASTDTRIDYILVASGAGCAVGFERGDVRGFADQPAEPNGESGVVFVSDHSGVIAELRCS